MEAQRSKRHVTCVNIDVRAVQPWTSIRFAMDVKRVEIVSLHAKTIWSVAWRVASDMSLRTRSRRQISGLIPCTTTRN